MEQIAEKRMEAQCDCQPQIRMRYHTVPFLHRDSYALQVLANVMSGRTGRLYKGLVLGEGLASNVSAAQNSQKYAGYFSISAESKGTSTPGELEAAIDAEIARLRAEQVPERELQKVKNQITADNVRRLERPFFLLIQLLYFDGLGDWRYLYEVGDRLLAVTAEDVQRVAKAYLKPERRAVAHYERKEGTSAKPVPAELEGLPPQVRTRVMQQVEQIRAAEDVERLRENLARLQAQKGQAPPALQEALGYVESILQERIAELDEASEGGES
jgi:hypothetical protein